MTDTMSAASPLPQVEVKTSLAPGKRGPVGISPRTDYSRVNTGLPATPDAGATEQKTMAPRGAEMLPKIAASEGSMGTTAIRPTINDMVKAAMDGAVKAASISREASRQAQNMGEKTAEAAPAQVSSQPTDLEQAEKLANALDYAASAIRKEAAHMGGAYSLHESKVEPGKGPGALHVMESQVAGKDPFKPGNQGHGHSGQVAHSPAEGKSTPAGPSTQMANNMTSPAGFHDHQNLGMVNQKGTKVASIREIWSKTASSKELENRETAGMNKAEKGLEEAQAAHGQEKKEASFAGIVDFARAHITKVAEDAINPAHISAGAAVAPDTREGGQPGGVQAAGSQPSMVGSNQAAIDYKKSQAKSVPKSDLKAYISEPALSGATDKTLSMAFTHTGEAGTKFASANKTAAARALLTKIASEAEEKKDEKKKDEKKEKDSNMPGMC